MSPLASTKVLHPRFGAHHRPTVRGTHNATCRIEHGATGGGWTPETGPTDPTPVVTYMGPCRVQYLESRELDKPAADQATSQRIVTVSLDAEVPRQEIGARITITATSEAAVAALNGRTLTVESRNDSSIGFEHAYTCTDDQTNQPG